MNELESKTEGDQLYRMQTEISITLNSNKHHTLPSTITSTEDKCRQTTKPIPSEYKIIRIIPQEKQDPLEESICFENTSELYERPMASVDYIDFLSCLQLDHRLSIDDKRTSTTNGNCVIVDEQDIGQDARNVNHDKGGDQNSRYDLLQLGIMTQLNTTDIDEMCSLMGVLACSPCPYGNSFNLFSRKANSDQTENPTPANKQCDNDDDGCGGGDDDKGSPHMDHDCTGDDGGDDDDPDSDEYDNGDDYEDDDCTGGDGDNDDGDGDNDGGDDDDGVRKSGYHDDDPEGWDSSEDDEEDEQYELDFYYSGWHIQKVAGQEKFLGASPFQFVQDDFKIADSLVRMCQGVNRILPSSSWVKEFDKQVDKLDPNLPEELWSDLVFGKGDYHQKFFRVENRIEILAFFNGKARDARNEQIEAARLRHEQKAQETTRLRHEIRLKIAQEAARLRNEREEARLRKEEAAVRLRNEQAVSVRNLRAAFKRAARLRIQRAARLITVQAARLRNVEEAVHVESEGSAG